jgi:hypothetical protein
MSLMYVEPRQRQPVACQWAIPHFSSRNYSEIHRDNSVAYGTVFIALFFLLLLLERI